MKRPWLAITRTTIISGLLLSPMVAWGDTAPTLRAPLKNPTADTWRSLPAPTHSLADFDPSSDSEYCFDRAKEPYTAVVDAHFHAKPFGGPAMGPQELWSAFDRLGVRFVTYMGIGQILELDADCAYYLDCPGVSAIPSIKNDFANGLEKAALDPTNVHITLSMTFLDLAHPENAIELIELYDREFPDMFSWSGELNIIKQALLGNNAEPATIESIDKWAPFMALFRERGIPVTLHSDLGNDDDPTKFLHLMDHVLETYPDNKIVWAHMGLSKELSTMDPKTHAAIMASRLAKYPNLYLDISWDVIWNSYHQWGETFIDFFEAHPTRIVPGSDFVAAGYKSWETYASELEVTSRALRVLNDEAFRNIALGQNYFDLMELSFEAPPLCD